MPILDLLRSMTNNGASDLFIFAGKRVSVRINGRMTFMDATPISEEEIATFRQSNLLERAEREFQDTGNYDTGLTLEDGHRYRINFLLRQGLPGLVARAVPKGDVTFAELNLPPIVERFANTPRGLIMIVGAAGSGKSTTMAAILHHINQNFAKHVITIEDPIEFVHDDIQSLITQREVGADTVGFFEALRGAVRESPDCIFIGEARDFRTIQAAVSAALTGHLVVTTMHTADVTQSLERIINHFPETSREQAALDLSLALRGVVAQRLVPQADGRGRVPATEILDVTPLARNLIAARDFNELEQVMRRGEEEGMVTFNRRLAELCKDGQITPESGAEAATNQEEFKLLIQGMETGVDTFRGAALNDADENALNMKRLLHSAIANGASDLALTVGARPNVRIDGEMLALALEPLTPIDTKRLLYSVLTTRQRAKFESEREIDFALSLNIRRSKDKRLDAPLPYRFRINGFFQRGNIAISIRIISTTIPNPETLNLPEVVTNFAEKKQGLVLITGPTGHGKSTTMASLIDKINRERACHIITVEDPIEYVHYNASSVIEQREVGADTLSFANALKYVLRQDPDVILVGEMRDLETIGAAITAAETGHLVMGTLHTNSATEAINRIVDCFPAHQQNQIRIQLAACLEGIVYQRLIPRRDGNGRVGAFEVLVGSTGIRALIREGKTQMIQSMIESGARDGMITMDKAVQNLYTQNLISREEALKLIHFKDKLQRGF